MSASRKFAPRAALFASLWAIPTGTGAQTSEPAITRLQVTPAVRSVAVGDSLRLRVQALDARGNVVPDVAIRFQAQGGRFQGSVDSLGFVRGGSPGTVPIAIMATPQSGRRHVEKVEVKILPGPAARITLSPAAAKLLVGQRLNVDAVVLTASGDE
ncbi:MAG: hypothetical protein ACRENU_08030, partial [Gemmatimonadaceae bacterium]